MRNFDAKDIENLANNILPQEGKRKLCLKIFSEAINYAASCGQDKWGVHAVPGSIQLLVGNFIVFTIEKGGTWFALDSQLLDSSEIYQLFLVDTNGWKWDEKDYPRYSQVSSRNGYYIPQNNHSAIWPILRLLHFEFVKKATDKYKQLKKTSQVNHNSAILDYLSSEIGEKMPFPIYETLEQSQDDYLKNAPNSIVDSVNVLTQLDKLLEGTRKQITANVYERNPAARTACLAHYGYVCVICGFNFEKQYGKIGAEYIHVHHLKPVSEIGIEYEVDPIHDLRPVCPNCHAMIHTQKPPYAIEALKEKVKFHFDK